ncbi:hypothetical protein ACGF5M_03020 [Gemmatimonadota bacterium]
MSMARAFMTLLPLAIVAGACAGAGPSVELDVPDDVKAELDSGAPAETYIYYALAESPPTSWEEFQAQGLSICDGRPPLIPPEIVAMVDGGGFLAGTLLGLSSGDFESATQGRVQSVLEMSVRVSIGITLQGCINSAIEAMEESPGVVLLTEREADFEGKDRMAEILFR